ncbi:hypothetical protein FF38_12970 [Lucilia cuprina]|uniref:Thioredoxin domain-containing protein n=1 Tax=Lucilia cuprina TaxID=7375 RepID=A0A0L0C287_LUCCU|nr:hypothetical protein CVS40_0949 [Lucilia cuprina]KNC25544.1 hypothetical protein FF38_12970 [Lucilia cuprina]
MDAETNYIPFEYCANSYPIILFIPYDDKKNFIFYEYSRLEENIIDFLKDCLEKPEYLKSLQEYQSSRSYKTAKVPADFSLDFNELPAFLHQHYDSYITLLNRRTLGQTKQFALIVFMDFQGKCTAQHVEWLNKLYQVAETCYSFIIFLADFKEINVINNQWNSEILRKSAQGIPQIYAFDRLKNIYRFGNFDKPTSLFYFTESLVHGDFYYSEIYKSYMDRKLLIKHCCANYLKIFLKIYKKHIFITFYSSDNANTDELVNLLQSIAQDVKDSEIEVVMFDVKFNYLSLEFVQTNYPVHYFIPKNNKSERKLYVYNNLSLDKMLEFIKNNIKTN